MSLLAMLSSLAGFVKVRYLNDKAVIDNFVFRLHYKITTALFFVCCLLVTATNLFGDPINCIVEGNIPEHVINTFCWITYTFTIPGRGNPKEFGHPGLGPTHEGQEYVYHSYYQWVPFMLFFQGVLFYIPHWLWKGWEDGKVRMISESLRGPFIAMADERKERRKKLVYYMVDNLHAHNKYAYAYFFCEFLNVVSLIANMALINSFLGGTFMTYGTKVLDFISMDQENRTDPMIEIFPRVTKCTFHKYGPSGSIIPLDALCVLALNIVNEKIYIFLWFWLLALGAVSVLGLIYSVLLILLPSFREFVLVKRFRFGAPTNVSVLLKKLQLGDFLMIHFLGQNLNMLCFGEFLEEMCNKLHISNNIPTAPSTMELSPVYSNVKLKKLAQETET